MKVRSCFSNPIHCPLLPMGARLPPYTQGLKLLTQHFVTQPQCERESYHLKRV